MKFDRFSFTRAAYIWALSLFPRVFRLVSPKDYRGWAEGRSLGGLGVRTRKGRAAVITIQEQQTRRRASAFLDGDLRRKPLPTAGGVSAGKGQRQKKTGLLRAGEDPGSSLPPPCLIPPATWLCSELSKQTCHSVITPSIPTLLVPPFLFPPHVPADMRDHIDPRGSTLDLSENHHALAQ